jgi:hypothetical protein
MQNLHKVCRIGHTGRFSMINQLLLWWCNCNLKTIEYSYLKVVCKYYVVGIRMGTHQCCLEIWKNLDMKLDSTQICMQSYPKFGFLKKSILIHIW